MNEMTAILHFYSIGNSGLQNMQIYLANMKANLCFRLQKVKAQPFFDIEKGFVDSISKSPQILHWFKITSPFRLLKVMATDFFTSFSTWFYLNFLVIPDHVRLKSGANPTTFEFTAATPAL
jgi:hypothetical protein